MIKILLLSLITISLAYSEIGTYLYTKNTKCIFDLQPNQNGNGFCYKYYTTPNTQRCTRTAKLSQFIKGYEYNTSIGECTIEHDLQLTGLNKEAQSNIMIFLSIAFSLIFFTTLFMLVF